MHQSIISGKRVARDEAGLLLEHSHLLADIDVA
jgi:hypothetical protein